MFGISLFSWIWIGAVTLVCGGAIWRGGFSERLAGGAIYAGWLASVLLADPDLTGAQWAILVVDALLLAVLIALALRSDRYWPMAAAGFHFLTIVTHGARVIDPTFDLWVYITAEIVWGYLMLSALAFGVWARWRERRAAQALMAEASPTLR